MESKKNKIIIAIDGHSSCGKSTLAKDLAKSLNYKYIDSGAMYRACTLSFLENEIDISKKETVLKALDHVHISIEIDQQNFKILLSGKDVTQRIIALDVSKNVSEVAAISEVRQKMVEIQKSFAADKGLVMDGRDIGSVVFPDAELKLFVTADVDVRTKRRFLELQSKNMASDYETVKKNLQHRDHIDSTREDSPLIQPEDAILIDNSFMSMEEQLFLALKLAKERIHQIV